MTEMQEQKLLQVWRIDWTEYERGWGSRPDGYTLYVRKVDADHAYNNMMDDRGGEVPDWYMNASLPRLVDLTVRQAEDFSDPMQAYKHYNH